jgi:carboxyl-terminal processing protease
VNKRTVFGGGGIMPDIFIPLDTSIHYAYINRLRRNNIIYNYTLDYIDHNREQLKTKYPQFKDFNTKFTVPDDIIAGIVENGIKEGIEKDAESLEFSRDDMKKEVKSLLARDLYERDDFYKVILKDDEAILKALEVIRNQKNYNKILVTTH